MSRGDQGPGIPAGFNQFTSPPRPPRTGIKSVRPRRSSSVRIESAPAEVWASIVDVERWPVWASGFKRLERLEPGPLAAGSRVRVSPKGVPSAVWQVTDYQEGRSFVWTSSPGLAVHLRGGHVVTPEGKATKVEFWLEASGVLGRLLAPILRRTVFSQNTRGATQGLKSYIEKQAHAPVP